jgi:hypothetical protein
LVYRKIDDGLSFVNCCPPSAEVLFPQLDGEYDNREELGSTTESRVEVSGIPIDSPNFRNPAGKGEPSSHWLKQAIDPDVAFP